MTESTAATVRSIEEKALQLGDRERAELARILLLSLDASEDRMDDQEVEAEWIAEAQRRLREVEAGSAETFSSQSVLAEARARLKK